MAAELENLSRRKPTELQKKGAILTIELAQKLNNAYLANVPDMIRLKDLSMNRSKRRNPVKHEGFQEWAETVQALTKQEKRQLNMTLLFAGRVYKNIGDIRNAEAQDMLSKPDLTEDRVVFLKNAFAKKQRQ